MNRPGFTFIELLLVVIIGSIIFSLALITFRDFSPQANLSVEKQTVASIKSGISFYHLDPARGDMSNFPAALDSAAAGSDASPANPFFGQVLFEPVTRGWRKTGANTWEATDSAHFYSYDPSLGIFHQVSAEAVPTTTTTTVTTTTTQTTTTTTTTTTTSTTTTIPYWPSVVTQPPTLPSYNNVSLNMTYDFAAFGSGTVQFQFANPSFFPTGWVSASGSGSYTFTLHNLSKNTNYSYFAQLKYGSTTISGSTVHFTTPGY